MLRKFLIALMIICFFSSITYAIDYVPTTQQPTATPQQQQQQQTETTNIKIAQMQEQITLINSKIDRQPTIETLKEMILILKQQNEQQLNNFLILLSAMQIVFFLGLGSAFFIFMGRGRIPTMSIQTKVIIPKKIETKKQEPEQKQEIKPEEKKEKKGFLFFKPKPRRLTEEQLDNLLLKQNSDMEILKQDILTLIKKHNTKKRN